MSINREIGERYAESTPEVPVAVPALVADAFTLSHLATDPEGFKVETGRQLRRNEEGYTSPLTDDERERLRQAMRQEAKFQGGPKVREARTALREAQSQSADKTVIAELEQRFHGHRQRYIRGMAGKVGLRDIHREGDTLIADIKNVAYPFYQEFAKPEDSEAVLDFSNLLGVSMAVRTADGRLVIQHRAVSKQRLDQEGLTRGNRVYSDGPGASVAGLYDASMDEPDRSPGTPDKVTSDSVRAASLKEAEEELGLSYGDIEKIRIVGLGHDHIRVHDELLLLTDSRLTAEELHQASRESKRNKNLGAADFEEKYFEIPATTEAIETLLTEVKAPLPPTHAALFIAAGYSIALQEQGLAAANDWRARMEPWVNENYRQMDEMVKTFYWQHPEALESTPERYWSDLAPERNPSGYSPDYTPGEQGLPETEEELVRTGLVPERRRYVESAFLFDVDGPITDPEKKAVIEPEVLDIIADRIENGEPVGFNTGRASAWVMERVVPQLLERIDNKAMLRNFVVIGEMGGTWVTFNEEGEAQYGQSQQLTVPDDMLEAIRKLTDEKYSDVMFVDPDKRTMVSIEMRQGQTVDVFDMRRAELGNELNQILAETGNEGRFAVEHTTIATDIQSKHVGKALGAERFVQLLRLLEIKPDQFLTFGDSPSDMEMTEELERRQLKALFVYVGEKEITRKAVNGTREKERFPVIKIGGYSLGTLRALGFLA